MSLFLIYRMQYFNAMSHRLSALCAFLRHLWRRFHRKKPLPDHEIFLMWIECTGYFEVPSNPAVKVKV